MNGLRPEYVPIQSSNHSDEEQSLARWIQNSLSGNISTSNSQEEALQQFLIEYKDLPQSGLEYRFKQMCDVIKVFMTKNFVLPNFENNPSEYNWLYKNLDSYEKYTDNRKLYFIDLLSFLKDYGFYLT